MEEFKAQSGLFWVLKTDLSYLQLTLIFNSNILEKLCSAIQGQDENTLRWNELDFGCSTNCFAVRLLNNLST